jgi:membrane protein
VAYKFGDDQGPYLTALITYYGFLSLFPLLLLLVTVLGFVLQGDSDLQARLVNSTLAELPIIGSQLSENVHALKGRGVGFAVGILARSTAASERRALRRMRSTGRGPCPATSDPTRSPCVCSLLLLLVLGAGVLVTTTLAGLTTARTPSVRP